MNILLLNGPNLNLLGEREPEIYGTTTFAELEQQMIALAAEAEIGLKSLQSNHEGQLIDWIQAYRTWYDALIFNPGALTHYSYALRDVIAAVRKPTIEVHLSDLATREAFRQHSVFEGLDNVRRIMGKGIAGYKEAFNMLTERI